MSALRIHPSPSAAAAIAVLLGVMGRAAFADGAALDGRMHHLRNGAAREWTEFPESAEGAELSLAFTSKSNERDWTLRLRQQDVKQAWRVRLNDRVLGELRQDENDMIVYLAVPAGTVRAGENRLTISTDERIRVDDIRVGEAKLVERPLDDVLGEGRVAVDVLNAESGDRLPCRITVLNEAGTLQTVGAESNAQMAVRPGVIYLGDWEVEFGLPAGEYTVYAGRGFEYGIDLARVVVKPGETARQSLRIQREVPTEGYVACDTHVHTLTHSGHGDATIEERMLTIAGEGIELPIATDHNKHIDYEAVARRMNVRQFFTPVIGNEVTTSIGHFNIFPVPADTPPPDHRPKDWETIFANICAVPGVQAIIFNHGRDIHSGYRPFGPEHHLSLTGENLDGWKLQANAMELINSGAQQTDVMQLFHDWQGLLNRGIVLTPVGSSDSHDVARHFVGQGRTYIRCDDEDPGAIDAAGAVRNFVEGRVNVSCGLLAEIEVNERFGPGELAPVTDDVEISVRVLGPGWTTAEIVELFMNGRKVREAQIDEADGKRAGVKWSGRWSLPRPEHDVHLAAVARGPGVTELYWPIAKPYQPMSPHVERKVIGISGAVWVDGDGDGERTPAYEYAQRVVEAAEGRIEETVRGLAEYDEAVAAQAAGMLQQRGVSLLDAAVWKRVGKAGPSEAVQRGFEAFREAWRASEIARRESGR